MAHSVRQRSLSQADVEAMPAGQRRAAKKLKTTRVEEEAARIAFVRGTGDFDAEALNVSVGKHITSIQADAARRVAQLHFDRWGGIWPSNAGTNPDIAFECKRIAISRDQLKHQRQTARN